MGDALRQAACGTTTARERLDKGLKLCEDITELAQAALPCAPLWQLLARVANQCLSYDSAILPPETCAQLGETLDSATLGASNRKPLSVSPAWLPSGS